MAEAIPLVVGTVVGGVFGGPAGAAVGAQAGGALSGALFESGATKDAAQLQFRSNQEALNFAREEARREQERWEEEQARLDAAWAADQARRAPYRNASLSILSGYYGYDVPESAWQTPERPEGWTPEMSGRFSSRRNPEEEDQSGFYMIPRRTPTTNQTISQWMRGGGGGGGMQMAR